MKALYKLRFEDVTELCAVLCTRLLGVLNTSNSLWYGEACIHYSDVIMSTMASQITSLTIVYPTIYSGVDQRQHQSYASLAFVRGIHQWPMNSQHKGPVTLKMFSFDDVSNSPMYRVIISSVNGLSRTQCRAIIQINAVVLLIDFPRTKIIEIKSKIQAYAFTKSLLKTSSANWRLSCSGRNVLLTLQGADTATWVINGNEVRPMPNLD